MQELRRQLAIDRKSRRIGRSADVATSAPRFSEKHNAGLSASTLSQPAVDDAGHDRRDEAAARSRENFL